MKKIIIGLTFLLTITVVLFATQTLTPAEATRATQEAKASQYLSEAIRMIAGMAYADGYKDGYLQAAVDCGVSQRNLEKKKVKR